MAPSSESSMNFTENEHGNIMLEKLRSQREEGRFCDVTLYVEGKIFRAHRSVLASCSPYFDSILKMHRVVKERLTVTCQNSEVFQCLINYMYTGNVNIDKENVNEMLRLANHFLVSKLKFHCEEYLEKSLDINNCLQVRLLAEKYNMIELSRNTTNFIQSHIQELVKHEEFLKCSSNQIQDFITDKVIIFKIFCAYVKPPSHTYHLNLFIL
jgi:kelch-like protein 11